MKYYRIAFCAHCCQRSHSYSATPNVQLADWCAVVSDGYSTDDISYSWQKGPESISKSPFELPQFRLADVKIHTKLENLSSGEIGGVRALRYLLAGVYLRLVCRFLFTRSIGFYIIQIYLPRSEFHTNLC
jgi:hypothetical protein